MKHKKQQSKNIKYAVIFCAAVVFLILGSVAVKTIALIKDSSFDGQHRFNLAVLQKNEVSVVSFSPRDSSITILNIKGPIPKESLGEFLEIPVDAVLRTNSLSVNKTDISSDMSKIFFGYTNENTSLTVIDAFRLYLFAKGLSGNSVIQADVQSNDKITMDSLVSSYFIDSYIANDGITIQVINGTSVYGLATRLGNLISNMGGDVVLVSSSDTPQENSEILYSGNLNYTVKRLSKYLGYKTVKSLKQGISDVTIIIGKDALTNLKY